MEKHLKATQHGLVVANKENNKKWVLFLLTV